MLKIRRFIRLSCVHSAIGFAGLLVSLMAACGRSESDVSPSNGWVRHAIDRGTGGADGVRLGDVNGDGRPDVATGWEEAGETRLYLHPGSADVRRPWPAVTIGKTHHVEDAVFADLDNDGALDVLSSTEGETRALYIHWAPRGRNLLDPSAWQQQRAIAVPAARWMYATPADVNGDRRTDLVVGAKEGGSIGWIDLGLSPRDAAGWTFHSIAPSEWPMSIDVLDIDGDTDVDILFTERKGPDSGAWWLENPGKDTQNFPKWARHPIGSLGREAMFAAVGDLDADGFDDLIVPLRASSEHAAEIAWHRRLDAAAREWSTARFDWPAGSAAPKAIAIGDIDGDGQRDLIYTCEDAGNGRAGVGWIRLVRRDGIQSGAMTNIAGSAGIKFDRVEIFDLDGDGDADVITTEERTGLGVIWYENPQKQPHHLPAASVSPC